METQKKIKQTLQKVAKLERQLARDKLKQRKAETRQKIEFGGLVIKAGMQAYSKDVVLGALLQAKERLQNEPGTESLYQSLGQAAFMQYDKNEKHEKQQDEGGHDSNA